MKKSVIALAAMAVVGGASAQVTISGIMDAYVGSGNNYGQKYSVVGQSGARTTTFKFNGVEDLGGGLRAVFQYEIQPQFVASDGNAFNTAVNNQTAAAANAGSQAGSQNLPSGMTGKGYSYVGIQSNGLGNLHLGTNNSFGIPTFTSASGMFNTGVGSAYGVIVGSTSTNTFTRFEDSVHYITPTMNGFRGSYLTNMKNDSQYGSTTGGITSRRPAVTELGIEWKNGPAQINAAMLKVKGSPNEATKFTTTSYNNYTPLSSDITTKTNTISGSYNLGVAQVGAIRSTIVNDAGFTLENSSGSSTLTSVSGKTDTKAQMLFAQMPMGAMRIGVSSGSVKVNNSPASVLNGMKTTFTGFAAEYDLSKRTYVYLRYQAGKAEAANAATTIVNGGNNNLLTITTNGNSAAQLTNTTYNIGGVGISHAF